MNDKVTVFVALTRRCHLRSQAAAAETADCRGNADAKRLWCVLTLLNAARGKRIMLGTEMTRL